jgi:hyperosmotically inducible protein
MNQTANLLLRLGMSAILFVSCLGVAAGQNSSAGQSAPDNTKTNAHRRANAEPTADQQTENASDRAITQQIRKAIVKDKSLSASAHNVKVITQNGQVTLAGPVRSEEEKKALQDMASSVAGVSNVNNQLQVAAKQ